MIQGVQIWTWVLEFGGFLILIFLRTLLIDRQMDLILLLHVCSSNHSMKVLQCPAFAYQVTPWGVLIASLRNSFSLRVHSFDTMYKVQIVSLELHILNLCVPLFLSFLNFSCTASLCFTPLFSSDSSNLLR